jgi:hypothetical protein
MPKVPGTAPASRREQDLAELIRKAQENPGVSEVMEVYSRAQATLAQAQQYLRAVNGYIQWVSDRTSAWEPPPSTLPVLHHCPKRADQLDLLGPRS